MNEISPATPEAPRAEEAFIRQVLPDVQEGASRARFKEGWIGQEDIVQDALIGMLDAYRRGRDNFTSAKSNLGGYASVAGRNSAISAMRRQQRRVRTTSLEYLNRSDDPRADTSTLLTDPTADTEHQALQALESDQERFDMLFAAASVPEAFRKPFLMAHIDGMSYKEIAQRLNVEMGTVQSRISRALSALRRYAGVTKGEQTRSRDLFDELVV